MIVLSLSVLLENVVDILYLILGRSYIGGQCGDVFMASNSFNSAGSHTRLHCAEGGGLQIVNVSKGGTTQRTGTVDQERSFCKDLGRRRARRASPSWPI